MDTEINRLQQLLINSWQGPMWHGTHLTEVLAGIGSEKAFQKPKAGSHNIYELVMHLYCWRNFVIQHLQGLTDFKVEINSAIDWPDEYQASEERWKEALHLLEKSQNELVASFSGFDETQLDQPMHGRKFSWYDLVHGVVLHDTYHSAQIVLLKK